MRIKRYIIVVAVALCLSSCVKPTSEEVRFSILGDSYSTFDGYVEPETNDIWTYYDRIGVTDKEQMWWAQVAAVKGWELERNNSFSGSLICNMNFNNYYAPFSFLNRMDDLGDPEVLFVFGGTNDVWDGAPLGEFVYGPWTEEQLCMFRPAIACLFDGIKRRYPGTRLYFMLDMNLGEGYNVDSDLCRQYLESVQQLAEYYGIRCIELHDIHKSWNHPDARGQNDIARQVLEVLGVDFNV